MRRRNFIALIGGAAAWPLAVRAQQPAMPVIGFLASGSFDSMEEYVAAVRKALSEAGYSEQRNIRIDYQSARAQYDRLPSLAAHLIEQHVDLIVTFGFPATLAAKSATSIIPIVFITGGDPVNFGLVASLNRPGGNVTGISLMLGTLGPKRLELLRELVPAASTIAILINPSSPITDTHLTLEQAAARELGQELIVARASAKDDLDAAFKMFAERAADALIVNDDPFFTTSIQQLVALAARYRLPAIYYQTLFATGGGLMSYGPSMMDTYRQAGIYAGRILKGQKPSDLPVLQPTKFELVINLTTARALGINVPPMLLTRADEVIE
jgi:putative tryptophan/tyrosine transport system substrate-binding protein